MVFYKLSNLCFTIYSFLQLVVMIGIRKGLDFVFTQRELKILDDVMPETAKRTEEELHLGDEVIPFIY